MLAVARPRSPPSSAFKAGVDLVQFSVVLTDKQGAPITGLKPEDFEIVEEGKPQTISYFSRGRSRKTATTSATCCRCTSG